MIKENLDSEAQITPMRCKEDELRVKLGEVKTLVRQLEDELTHPTNDSRLSSACVSETITALESLKGLLSDEQPRQTCSHKRNVNLIVLFSIISFAAFYFIRLILQPQEQQQPQQQLQQQQEFILGSSTHRRRLDQNNGQIITSPISVFQNHLLMADVVTSRGKLSEVDEHGHLKLFRDPVLSIERFSFDVGFNRGQTSYEWHRLLPSKLFVLGVDANANLVARFEHSSEFASIRQKTLVFRGAVGSKDGIALFNPGFGWENTSDTGSLFGWDDKNKEAERMSHVDKHLAVRFIRLDAILSHVPPPNPSTSFYWDTLKIDVQGADVDAMESAGDFIKNFMCVVGEFQTAHYKIPAGINVDPAPFLTKHGFKLVYHNANQIWLNPLYVQVYKNAPLNSTCHNVYDSKVDPVKLLSAYDSGQVLRL